MIAYIVCVGVMMVLMVSIGTVISHKEIVDFDGGVVFGILFSVLFVIEVSLIANEIEEPKPTAMDVYQGKTTLEYKIVDDVKTDSMVIFKKDLYEKD